LRLLYFAWVRQKIGTGEEQMTLPADVKTIFELMEYLRQRGAGYADAFGDTKRLRSAVNQEHASPASEICDEDEIAFFPPVTGG
jgi:molybdopterin synthase sulfur carrier subunit